MPSWNSACVPTTMRDLARGDGLEGAAARARAAASPTAAPRVMPERLEPALKVAPVLLGQQLGRRHEGGLQPAAGGARGRGSRATTVLPQPTSPCTQARPSGALALRSASDFGEHARLRAGQREGQRRDEAAARAAPRPRARSAGSRCQRALAQLQRQMVGEQFLEREAPLRRVPTGGELGRAAPRAAAGAGSSSASGSEGRPERQRRRARRGSRAARTRSSSRSASAMSARSRPCVTPSVAG